MQRRDAGIAPPVEAQQHPAFPTGALVSASSVLALLGLPSPAPDLYSCAMFNWICSTEGCWSATGSMLSGWAAVAGVIVLLVTAKLAFSTYRRQKQEDRRIEAAERVLTAAYRFRSAMVRIRSPMQWVSEIDDAHEKLDAGEDRLAKYPGDKVARMTESQILMTRWEQQLEILQAVDDAMPSTKAIFGDKAEGRLQGLLQQANKVRAAAQSHAVDAGLDAQRTEAFMTLMWAGMGAGEDPPLPDRVAVDIDAEITALEGIMTPVLRVKSD